MKNFLHLIAIFACIPLFAQTEKGASPISQFPISQFPTTTRAVVIGISDYQDDAIPDLRFADKDAEAFANYLRSPAGGSLDGDHLKLLTNHQATAAQFVLALDWLIDETKEDDKVIIYFSGHGDVEKKTLIQPGYLLCWDTPSRVYMAGGAFNLRDIQDIISTLSIQNKARVIVLADACHSGKLSGSAIGGPQATATNLAKQYANEIKILSCQPNEFSVEGEQWGGGRGAFSYHLLNGMYGMADANQDGGVSLFEIGRYLEDHVSAEVAPIKQLPLIVGDRSEEIAQVVPSVLADIQKNQQPQGPVLSKTETHGLEELVLEDLDESTRAHYFSFQKALLEKRFLEPSNDCAEAYFGQLMKEPMLAALHASIRRNYAAALQDEAQQVINKLLQGNRQEVTLAYVEQIKEYKDFPRLLGRSADLLGTSHYIYQSLKARQYLFEGYLLYLENRFSDLPETTKTILEKYRQSLHLEPDSPVANYYMSECFATKVKDPDSTWHYAMQAAKYAETWVLPYTFLAYNLSLRFRSFARAKEALDKAKLVDSTDYNVWIAQGTWHFYQEQYPQAIAAYQKATQIDSTIHIGWFNLGACQIAINQNDEAEKTLLKAIRIKPVQFNSYNALGILYNGTGRVKEAEEMFLKAIEYHPRRTDVREKLALVFIKQDGYKEAEQQYLEIIKINPASTNATVWYNLACFAALDGRHGQSLEYLKKSIQNGTTWDAIQNEKDLDAIRSESGFEILMKKYFPQKAKD